jgi:hypothetical protein
LIVVRLLGDLQDGGRGIIMPRPFLGRPPTQTFGIQAQQPSWLTTDALRNMQTKQKG